MKRNLNPEDEPRGGVAFYCVIHLKFDIII